MSRKLASFPAEGMVLTLIPMRLWQRVPSLKGRTPGSDHHAAQMSRQNQSMFSREVTTIRVKWP